GDSLGAHVPRTEGQPARRAAARFDGLGYCCEPAVRGLLHVDFTPVRRPRRVIDAATISSEVPLDGLAFGGFVKGVLPIVAPIILGCLCAQCLPDAYSARLGSFLYRVVVVGITAEGPRETALDHVLVHIEAIDIADGQHAIVEILSFAGS